MDRNARLSHEKTIRSIHKGGEALKSLASLASYHLLESYSNELASGQSQQLASSMDSDAAAELATRRLSSCCLFGIEAGYPAWPLGLLLLLQHLPPLLIGQPLIYILLELMVTESRASTEDNPAIRNLISN